jgi:NADH-quinone oxidoreductase subunit N
MITFQSADMLRILPEAILSVFAVLVMFLVPFFPEGKRSGLGWIALIGIVCAGLGIPEAAGQSSPWAFGGAVAADSFALYFTALFLLVAALTILSSLHYLIRDNINHGEYYALILMATVGMCFMAASTDLMMVFIGLEVSSISTYILAGFKRTDPRSNEASLKYFLLGSFATAFFLYGIAFVYGFAGTTNLSSLHEQVGVKWPVFADAALLLMFVGLAFKVSAVPFQVWTPDVYQGAPAPVSAFLSVGPKAAAFAILLRVIWGMSGAENIAFWLLWVSAVLTMVVGNLGAIRQTNIKRMLAYSSIAHAGYILVGICAGSSEGTSAVLFYLVAYSLMNLGAFVMIAHLSGTSEKWQTFDDYTGLAYKRPGVAACLSLILLALAGFPTTAGFLGKFYIFRAAVHSHLIGLTVIALLASVVSVYYYLHLLVVMYMKEGATQASTEAVPWPLGAALAVSVIGIFYLGLFPNQIVWLSTLAGKTFP